MKYDKRDKTIIEMMYHNWRLSSSELGRRVRLSRRKVDYRIKNYFSDNIIRSIFTIPNYSLLGFHKPAYFFVKTTSRKHIQQIGEYLEETKRCTSWGAAWTEYDLFSNLIFKNKKEMRHFIADIKSRFADKISKQVIVSPLHAELYPLKFIGNMANETYSLSIKRDKKISLDAIDLNILDEIKSDARKPVVQIATNLKISPEKCLYRLRRLVKAKVILGSRIQFNLKQAGYFATCLFVQTSMNDEVVKKLKYFAKEEAFVNYLIISSKYPQIIIQVFHQNESELRQIIKRISLILTDYNISIVELEDDINIVNPMPFF